MKHKSNILDFEVMLCARDNKISYQTALKVYGDLVFQDVYSKDFEMFCMGRPESDYHEQLFEELRRQIYDAPIETSWTNSPDDFYKFWYEEYGGTK